MAIIRKQTINDKKIDLNNYNAMVDKVNQVTGSDASVDTFNNGIAPNIKEPKEKNFEVRQLGEQRIRVKIGNYVKDWPVKWVQDAYFLANYADNFVQNISTKYGLSYNDYYVYEIPVSLYTTNDADTTLGTWTSASGGIRTIYLVLSYYEKPSDDERYGYFFLTNSNFLANKNTVTEISSEDRPQHNIIGQRNVLVAEIDIYPDAHIKSIRQKHDGDAGVPTLPYGQYNYQVLAFSVDYNGNNIWIADWVRAHT